MYKRQIRKSYQLGEQEIPVLKGITTSISRGELVALTGASGSGKSTLMNILGCLDRPTSGRYMLDGEDVSNLSREDRAVVRGRKIGFVFQNFNLLSRTTALDNILMPLTYARPRVADSIGRERGLQLLERVGLGERSHHFPSQLSGGQMQRVAIARAIINDPPILLADEPTGNLDSRTRVEILEMFHRLNEEQGLTILIVTHDPEVAEFARRTIRMKDGLIEAGAFTEEKDR